MPIFPPVDPLSIAVYVALGGVVFVATRRRPSDAIVALVATAPFDFSHALGPTTVTFDKVALLAATLALLLRRPSAGIFARGAPRTIGIAIVAVIAATALSIAVAQYHGPAVRETFKWVQYLLIFGVAAIAWSLDPDRRRLQIALTITVSIVAILALAQELTGSGSGVWLNADPYPKAYPRIAGPLEGPNQLAAYLGIALPFFVVWVLDRPSWPMLVANALTAVALLLTLSRAGIACAIVAIAIVFAVRRASLRKTVLAVLAASVVIAALVIASWHAGGLAERFLSLDEPLGYGGVGTRRRLWHAAIELWRQHPWLGVGAGNYELLLPTAGEPKLRTHANSWYLQSLVEGGIPLLAATCTLVWASIAPFRRALSNPLCLATFAASIAFALHGLVDYLVFYPKVAITWFAVLGVASIETCGQSRS